MNEVSIAYINALLADASYRTVTTGMTNEQLADELESRMTTTQASYIAANFEVLNSETSPTGGFESIRVRYRLESQVGFQEVGH